MQCRHCEHRLAPHERENAAEIGSAVPLCDTCTDIAVWGGRCAECEARIVTHRHAPSCRALIAAGSREPEARA